MYIFSIFWYLQCTFSIKTTKSLLSTFDFFYQLISGFPLKGDKPSKQCNCKQKSESFMKLQLIIWVNDICRNCHKSFCFLWLILGIMWILISSYLHLKFKAYLPYLWQWINLKLRASETLTLYYTNSIILDKRIKRAWH